MAAGKDPIRVLLVDDSRVALAVMERMLARAPDIRVVGTAENGKEALKLLPDLKPDVICTDLLMPVMDGLEFTRAVMAVSPRPILVVSSTVRAEDATNAYPTLEAGALDVLPKPVLHSGEEFNRLSQEFVTKIRILSGVRVYRRRSGAAPAAPPEQPPSGLALETLPRAIVIGASTGGPPALRAILRQLPADYPVPILCVQHISEGFLAGLVEWLAGYCQLRVTVAAPGEKPQPGTVHFPEEGRHLDLDGRGAFVLSAGAPVDGHRPSVTVTMNAVSRYYGSGVVGVLLTGMGRDGADGMAAIMRRGGLTIAQDEQSCVVYGMPRQAVEMGAVRHILGPAEIGRLLAGIPGRRENGPAAN